MFDFPTILLATAMLTAVCAGFAWTLVQVADRISLALHKCWTDESVCGECIDDRQRAQAPHAYR